MDDTDYDAIAGALSFSSNCYYSPNTAPQFVMGAFNNDSQNTRPQYGVKGGIYTFAQWQALTNNGQMLGYDTNSVVANPMFVNAATNDFRLQADSPCAAMGANMQAPVGDTTAPTVSVTSPSADSTVSGLVNMAATASDNVAVAGVQFMVDGSNLGSEDVTAPYTTTMNTSLLVNGLHTLTARARDVAGNSRSNSITVTVNNTMGPSNTLTIGGVIKRTLSMFCPACSVSIALTGATNSTTTTTGGLFSMSFARPATGSYTLAITITDGATTKTFRKRISIA